MTLVEMSRASIFSMRHLHPKEYRRNLFVPRQIILSPPAGMWEFG